MAVPDFQSFFRPMLQGLADGVPKSLSVMREQLRSAMVVSDADFQEMLPSGVRTRFADRVYWANTHLYHAGLIERPSSGVLAITGRGRAFLAKHPGKILVNDLMQFPEFATFRGKSSAPLQDSKAAPAAEKTPQERIEEAYAELRATTAKELLGKRVVLIDGDELVRLMMDFGLGVRTVKEFVVLAPDADVFDTFES